jgi:hypothetical protein
VFCVKKGEAEAREKGAGEKSGGRAGGWGKYVRKVRGVRGRGKEGRQEG